MIQEIIPSLYFSIRSSSEITLIAGGKTSYFPAGIYFFETPDESVIQHDNISVVKGSDILPLITRQQEFPDFVAGKYFAGDKFRFYSNLVYITADVDLTNGISYITSHLDKVLFLSVMPSTIAMHWRNQELLNSKSYLLLNGSSIGIVGSGATYEGPQYELLHSFIGGTYITWNNGTKISLKNLAGYFPAFYGTSPEVGATKRELFGNPDKFQDHSHYVKFANSGDLASVGFDAASTFNSNTLPAGPPTTSNSFEVTTARSGRIGTDTHPAYFGLYPFIKY